MSGPFSAHLTPGSAPNIAALASLLVTRKHIVVLAGAGISTASGIPDFRSPGTGLYDNLQAYSLPSPESIFDLNYLRQRPQAFFTLSKHIYPGKHIPSRTHAFFKLLHSKARLLRIFTQNIDTLERLAGLPAEALVEAHGSFAGSHCIDCNRAYEDEWMRSRCRRGEVARCEKKRCGGIVKPDIVFFGEGLPDRFFERLPDLGKAELLLVLGTSLQVQPFASLISRVPPSCPRALLNLERVGDDHFGGFDFDYDDLDDARDARDVWIEGTTDASCDKIAELCGWKNELEKVYEDIKTRVLKEQEALRDERVASLDPALTEVSLDAPTSSGKGMTASDVHPSVTSSADSSSEASTEPSSEDVEADLAAKLDRLTLPEVDTNKKSVKKLPL